MTFHKTITAAACVTICVAASAVQGSTIVHEFDKDAPFADAPFGISSFISTGATIAGMTVTAFFQGGAEETLTWASTGFGSGGATGSLFSIAVDGSVFAGNTFASPFILTNLSTATLLDLVFDGAPGSTGFDTGEGGGTPGSENGLVLVDQGGIKNGEAVDAYFPGTTEQVFVMYSRLYGLAGQPPEPNYSLFAEMRIETGRGGGIAPGDVWKFLQDTDDLRSAAIPVPAALPLLGGGLALLGLMGWRKRRAAA